MSGISGIWHLDGKPLTEELLSRVSERLAHRGPDAQSQWRDRTVGLASNLMRVTCESLNETQPAVHASGCVLVFDGRLDNREELLVELAPTEGLSAESPDSLLCLHSYLRHGNSFPKYLNGDFALALFDPRVSQLLLARDPIGVRPLYYYRDAELFVFGSEVKAVLAHPCVRSGPNESYLAVTLMGGMPPRDTELTQFQNIMSLAPAHTLLVNQTRCSSVQYWDFDLSKQVRLRSSAEYEESFRHYFRQAVKRRLRSAFPVAISVSGGLDSSSIFCMAQSLKVKGELSCPDIFGVTHRSEPGAPSDEIEYVQAIERMYGVQVEGVAIEFRGILEGIDSSVMAFESPLGDLQWYNNLRILEAAKRRGAKVKLTGHWGDQILFEQEYLVDMFWHLRWRTIAQHLREYPRWVDADPKWFRKRFFLDLIKHLIPRSLRPAIVKVRARNRKPSKDRPWYSDRFRQLAAQSLSGYQPSKAEFASAHSRSMYEEVRAKYYVQAMEWHNKAGAACGTDMTLPFLDRDLLLYLMAIPGAAMTPGGVHRGLLRNAMRGILPDEIVLRRNKASYSYLVNATMERQYTAVSRFFSTTDMGVRLGLVDSAGLQQELRKLAGKMDANGCRTAWDLSDLVALEVWLKQFFGPVRNSTPGPENLPGQKNFVALQAN